MTTYNLFPAGTTLPSAPDGDTGAITLGTEFYVTDPGCTVTHLRWWVPGSSSSLTGRQGALFTVNSDASSVDQVLTTVNFPDGVAGTWCEVALGTPFALTEDQRYRVGVFHPGGRYPATGGYFNDGEGYTDLIQGPVVRPDMLNAAGDEQGSYGPENFLVPPQSTFNGGCYFSDVTISDGGAGNVTVSPTAIASDEAFGTAVATTTLTAEATAIASAEALGEPTVTATLTASPSGIAGAEELGTPAASTTLTASPDGIAPAEAFGTPEAVTVLTASPSGIASDEAFGTPALSATLTASPSGIGSEEALGTPSATNVFTASPAGIASAETFGSPAMSGALTVSPAGIGTAEAFGSPMATGSPVVATAVGIGTLEVFGTATANKKLTTHPTGIATAAAMGTPAAVHTPASVIATAVAIATLEVFGTPTATGSLGPSPAAGDPRTSSRYSGAYLNHRWDGSLG